MLGDGTQKSGVFCCTPGAFVNVLGDFGPPLAAIFIGAARKFGGYRVPVAHGVVPFNCQENMFRRLVQIQGQETYIGLESRGAR